MKYKTKHTIQQEENDCGLAAVSIILKTFDIDHSYNFLRDIHYTNSEYTPKDIILLLKQFNIDCKPYRFIGDSLPTSLHKLSTPCIALIEKNGRGHYIVIHEKRKDSFVISDPNETTTTKMKFGEFTKVSQGIFIVPLMDSPAILTKMANSHYDVKILFIDILKKNSGAFFKIIFFSILFLLLSFLNTYFFKIVIDYFIPNKALDKLNLFLIAFLILNFTLTAFGYFRSQIIVVLSNKIDLVIAQDYFKHLTNVSGDFHAKRSSGDLISRYEDALQIRDILNKTVIGNFLDVTIALIASLILFFINKIVLLVTLFACLIFFVVSILYYKVIKQRVKAVLESKASVQSFLVQFLSKMETIISFNRTGYFYTNVIDKIKLQQQNLYRLRTIENQSGAVKSIILNLFYLFVLWRGTIEIINGRLVLGDLVLYVTLLNFVISSVNSLVDFQVELQGALVTIRRFADIMEYPAVKNGNKEITEIESIKVSSLSYGYNLEKKIFECENLTINNGDKVVFTGQSGSGKSTLSKILARLIDSPDNKVFINQMDINEFNINSIREQITYVGNDALLFEGTFLENICMGKEVSEEQLRNVIRASQLEEVLEHLPMGLHTKIYEDGRNLSSGEKQRINLARALLRKQDFLILDESLSHVDQANISKILNNLINMEFSLIFISHKETNLEIFDKIIEFNIGYDGVSRISIKESTLENTQNGTLPTLKEENMDFSDFMNDLETNYKDSSLFQDLSLIIENDILYNLAAPKLENLQKAVTDYEYASLPNVTCGILTFNEEENIIRLLDSLDGEFDQVIVLDSFSTDRTPQLIQQQFPEVEVYFEKWVNNFSHHRNFIIELSKNKWIYFIDADNIFQKEKNHLKLRRIARLIDFLNIEVVLCPIIQEHNQSYTYDNRRFFPIDKGIKFHGSVHEEPLLADHKEPFSFHMKVDITHDGYRPEVFDKREKHLRNYTLNKEMVNQEPSNPKWYYFLARSLYFMSPMENSSECLFYLKKGAQLYTQNTSRKHLLQNLLLQVEIHLNRLELEEARSVLQIVENEDKNLSDIYYYKALLIFNEIKGKTANFLIDSYEKTANNPNSYSIMSPENAHIQALYSQIAEDLGLFDLKNHFLNGEENNKEHVGV